MKKLFLFAVLLTAFVSTAQVTGPKLTYATVGNLRSAPTHAVTDTITNTTVKYQYGIVIAPSSYQYYRIVVTPTGTQSTKIATKALIRQ